MVKERTGVVDAHVPLRLNVPPPPSVEIVMDNCFVLLPAALVALTVKVDVPAVVGVPEIALPVRLKPAGNVPFSRLHVMGVSPVAASVWLYAVPVVPFGNVVVVIVGAVTSFCFVHGPLLEPVFGLVYVPMPPAVYAAIKDFELPSLINEAS